MKSGKPTGQVVDDGHVAGPGDDGFDAGADALAQAFAAGGDEVNYMGASDTPD